MSHALEIVFGGDQTGEVENNLLTSVFSPSAVFHPPILCRAPSGQIEKLPFLRNKQHASTPLQNLTKRLSFNFFRRPLRWPPARFHQLQVDPPHDLCRDLLLAHFARDLCRDDRDLPRARAERDGQMGSRRLLRRSFLVLKTSYAPLGNARGGGAEGAAEIVQ